MHHQLSKPPRSNSHTRKSIHGRVTLLKCGDKHDGKYQNDATSSSYYNDNDKSIIVSDISSISKMERRNWEHGTSMISLQYTYPRKKPQNNRSNPNYRTKRQSETSSVSTAKENKTGVGENMTARGVRA